MFRPVTVAVVVAALGFALTACTTAIVPSSSPSGTPSPNGLVDPLVQLTSADNGFPLFDTSVPPVVSNRGTGPGSVEVDRPNSPVTGIMYFLNCAPEGPFTVTMGTSYSGHCKPAAVTASGGIPLPAGDERLKISIDVPAGVQFWLVGIPTSAAK